MKFWQKLSIGVLYLNLIEKLWKFSLRGDRDFATKPPFWVLLTGLRVTHRSRITFFHLAKPSIY